MMPPFAYYGGKTQLADRIVALLPRHRHYVEPFAGSLAVLLAKTPAHMETVNDLDGDLMTFWRVLRDRPAELIRSCALTPHSRGENLDAFDRGQVDELERARRVWVRLTQGRSGTLAQTGWRHFIDPAGSPSTSMPDYLEAYVARMPAIVQRLRRVSLESRPAVDLIERYGRNSDVLIYADPPYVASTCNGEQKYRHVMTDGQHRELGLALIAARAAVVISGYDSPLYRDLYDAAGWQRHEFATATGQGGAWADRTEVLWCNRPSAELDLFGGVSS